MAARGGERYEWITHGLCKNVMCKRCSFECDMGKYSTRWIRCEPLGEHLSLFIELVLYLTISHDTWTTLVLFRTIKYIGRDSWPNVVLMVAHRLRCRHNINTTLGQRGQNNCHWASGAVQADADIHTIMKTIVQRKLWHRFISVKILYLDDTLKITVRIAHW